MDWSTLSALRGAGDAATGSLIQYPAALVMQGIDKLVGDGKLTQEEALRFIREQRARDWDEHTASTALGTLAGSLVPAGKIFQGGNRALKAIGYGTGLGAAHGFSANAAEQGTTLKDTATGAVLGGALSTVGAGAGKLLDNMAAAAARNGVFARIMGNAEAKAAIRARLKADGVKRPTDEMVRRAAREDAAQTVANMSQREMGAAVVSPKSPLSELMKHGVTREVVGLTVPTVLGGGVGAASTLLSGQDLLPAMATGAGASLALAKGRAIENVGSTLSAAAGRGLARYPAAVNAPTAAGIMATGVVPPHLLTSEPLPSELREPPGTARRSSGVVVDMSELDKYRDTNPLAELEQYRVRGDKPR